MKTMAQIPVIRKCDDACLLSICKKLKGFVPVYVRERIMHFCTVLKSLRGCRSDCALLFVNIGNSRLWRFCWRY